MNSLSFSPDPRSRLLNSQKLVHSSVLHPTQPLYPHNSFHISSTPSRKILVSQPLPLNNNGDSLYLNPHKRSSSQTNLNNFEVFAPNAQYLQALESKVRLVLQENERLSRAVEEKDRELLSFQQIEPKVKLLLEENRHLNELLQGKGSENAEKNCFDAKNMEKLVQENEKLEALLENLQENFKGEMEAYQQETEAKILQLLRENEKINELREKIHVVLQENEQMHHILNEKNGLVNELLGFKQENEEKIKALCEENEKLQDIIAQKCEKYEKEASLEPKFQAILEKNAELLRIIDEKNAQIREFKREMSSFRQKTAIEHASLNEIELQMQEYEQFKAKFIEIEEENSQLLAENQHLREKSQQSQRYSAEDFEKLEEKARNLEEKLLIINKEFVQELKHSETEKTAISSNLKDKCQQLLGENEKLLSVLREKTQELSLLSKKVEELSEELQENASENQELKARILSFKEEFENFKDFIALDQKRAEFLNSFEYRSLELEISNFAEKCSVLQEERELAWSENEKLREILTINSKKLSKDAIEIENLSTQIKQTSIEKDFLEHKLSDFEENHVKIESELGILNTQLTQWKNANDNSKGEINKLYNLLKSRKQENQQLLSRNEEMQQEIHRLNKTLTEMSSENFVFKEKVPLLENELEKVSIESRKFQELCRGLEENLEKFRNEIGEKTQDLENLRRTYHEFVSQARK